MKKFISYLLILALLVSMLAGCGTAPASDEAEPECQHQWSEADCLNGSSCTLCGEVQPGSSGHDWAEASCESPEQCTRCGETRGDVLEHSFGKWILSSEYMYRVCALCGQSENEELDYALYLDQHIFGHWNLHSVVQNGQVYPPEDIPYSQVDSEIWFREDGSVVSRTFAEKELSQSWSFDRAEHISEQEILLYITDPNNTVFRDSFFVCFEDQIYYVTPDSNGNMLILSKDHGEAMTPVITGTWSAWSEDGLYSITLSEDRTFTADLDGGISGFWLPRVPVNYGLPFETAKIMLNYSNGGKNQTLDVTLQNYTTDAPSADLLNLTANVNGNYVQFALNAEQALTEALATANSTHLGTWTSTEYSTYCYTFSSSDGFQETSESPKMSTDYSITFLEDGTFQANLQEELTGKWKLKSINMQDKQIHLSYHIIVPDIDESSYFEISPSGKAYLSVSKLTQAPRSYESAQYTFQQLTQEDIAAQNALAAAAPSMLVGEWFHTDLADSSCIFNEDGTFTAQSGTGDQYSEVSGNWYFSSLSTYDNYSYYFYDIETTLESEESEGTEPQTIRESRTLILSVRNGIHQLEAVSSFLTGTFTNAESIALNQEAASKILGRWHAETATKYDSKTKQSQEVQGNFSIDIAEDGTFTSHVLQDIQGSYAYFETEGEEIHYLFSFANGNQIDAQFSLKDGVLQGYINSHIIDFTR